MATEGEPIRKRAKRNEEQNDVFKRFHMEFLPENPTFFETINRFKEDSHGLGVYTIISSNAADPAVGYSFTKAQCTLIPTDVKFAFSNFFVEALVMLKKYIKDKEEPTQPELRLVLSKLLNYLMNKEMQKPLADLKKYKNGTDITVLLAFHMFSELSCSPSFTVDCRKNNQIQVCPCKVKHAEINYGDTSIGNLNVWHGFFDLIMEGADVIVDTIDGEEEMYKDIDSTVEVKQKQFLITDNSIGSGLVQVAAKTIVYSFYYRKLHPEHPNTLIPTIGVSPFGLIFYFYDCVNDLILGSTNFPLTGTTGPFKLSFTAVIAVWLVLNHKHLCNGLELIKDDDIPKAEFKNLAGEKLEIYQNDLKRGDVGTRQDALYNLDPASFINHRFILATCDKI